MSWKGGVEGILIFVRWLSIIRMAAYLPAPSILCSSVHHPDFGNSYLMTTPYHLCQPDLVPRTIDTTFRLLSCSPQPTMTSHSPPGVQFIGRETSASDSLSRRLRMDENREYKDSARLQTLCTSEGYQCGIIVHGPGLLNEVRAVRMVLQESRHQQGTAQEYSKHTGMAPR